MDWGAKLTDNIEGVTLSVKSGCEAYRLDQLTEACRDLHFIFLL